MHNMEILLDVLRAFEFLMFIIALICAIIALFYETF